MVKPAGTIQSSKFDKYVDKIQELLNCGLSVHRISKYFGHKNSAGLNNFI